MAEASKLLALLPSTCSHQRALLTTCVGASVFKPAPSTSPDTPRNMRCSSWSNWCAGVADWCSTGGRSIKPDRLQSNCFRSDLAPTLGHALPDTGSYAGHTFTGTQYFSRKRWHAKEHSGRPFTAVCLMEMDFYVVCCASPCLQHVTSALCRQPV